VRAPRPPRAPPFITMQILILRRPAAYVNPPPCAVLRRPMSTLAHVAQSEALEPCGSAQRAALGPPSLRCRCVDLPGVDDVRSGRASIGSPGPPQWCVGSPVRFSWFELAV
jgi:hypothetical protein